MRALSKNNLNEEDFEVFIKAPSEDSDLYFKTTPESVFKISRNSDHGYVVTILNK